MVATGPDNYLDFFWALDGTTQWHLERVQAFLVTPPAITTYRPDGSSDGVGVVVRQLFGDLTLLDQTNGSANWGSQDVYGEDAASSAASVTVNNGSLNIATFGRLGDLDFYWADSSGQFQKEVVALAGLN